MSIKPFCDCSKKELTDFGAILFSPPDKDGTVKKLHVCKSCYKEITKDFKTSAA